jgi:arylsulfatase A-like enzyme
MDGLDLGQALLGRDGPSPSSVFVAEYMSRGQVTALQSCAVCAPVAIPIGDGREMPKTNLLLIQSDQHRFDCLGVNGHPLVKTPHLDRLAAEGVTFEHAFCPIPLCVPARNSLLHGQWATGHLAIANYNTEAPRSPAKDLPTFTQALRNAGHFLGHVGKWHVNRERGPLSYGFHECVSEGRYATWRAAQGIPQRPRTNGWFGQIDPHIDPAHSRLAWGVDHVIRLMERAVAKDMSFYIQWNPSEPHLPNIVPEPYASLYPPEAIPPWPSFPDPLVGKPYAQAQQRRTWQVEGWTWADWAPIVSRYLGEISLLDAQVGRALAALESLGLEDNTLVVYTSDHGDLCGGHGMMDKHFVMYDDVTRVPLIVRWPGRAVAGQRCPAFVSHSLDLAATFCEAVRVPAPPTFRGQSLLPLLAGGVDNGRPDIFCTYHGNQFGLYSQRMVRDRRWKYVWNATAEDELYDLQEDPGEIHNLATNPAHQTEIARLRARLVAWMEETADPLLNPWIRNQLLRGLKV